MALLFAAVFQSSEFCPVRPDQRARPEHVVVHEGRTIYFCCDRCVMAFEADPDKYAAPRPGRAWWPALIEARPFLIVAVLTFIAFFVRRKRFVLTGGLIAALAAQLVWAYATKAAPAVSPEEVARQERYHAEIARAAGRQDVYAARQTYHRGNNERDPRLFNGGNYRTVTFELAIVGDRLEFELIRAPFTADGFFQRRDMAAVVLVRYPDDGAPMVRLETVEPDRRWRASYPLDKPRGTIYVAPCASNDPKAAWLLAHYAIAYDLGPPVRLWMAPTVISGPFAEETLHEWFGLEPLPELPGPNVDDPALLGLEPSGRPIPE